jgi:hypothetical protein
MRQVRFPLPNENTGNFKYFGTTLSITTFI